MVSTNLENLEFLWNLKTPMENLENLWNYAFTYGIFGWMYCLINLYEKMIVIIMITRKEFEKIVYSEKKL